MPTSPTSTPTSPTDPTTPTALIFDFGGVLFDWNPLYLYRKLLPTEDAATAFLTEIDFYTWNHQQDLGRPFNLAVDDLTARFPHHAALIAAYHHRYPESLAGPYPTAAPLITALHAAGWPLYGLTNWPAEKFDLVRPQYPFLNHFTDIVVSGQVRLAKPDPAIFTLLLTRNHLTPHHCLLIDDSLPNLHTAAALGLQTLHCTNPHTLAQTLRQHGIHF